MRCVVNHKKSRKRANKTWWSPWPSSSYKKGDGFANILNDVSHSSPYRVRFDKIVPFHNFSCVHKNQKKSRCHPLISLSGFPTFASNFTKEATYILLSDQTCCQIWHESHFSTCLVLTTQLCSFWAEMPLSSELGRSDSLVFYEKNCFKITSGGIVPSNSWRDGGNYSRVAEVKQTEYFFFLVFLCLNRSSMIGWHMQIYSA